jgi:hypothetical protein
MIHHEQARPELVITMLTNELTPDDPHGFPEPLVSFDGEAVVIGNSMPRGWGLSSWGVLSYLTGLRTPIPPATPVRVVSDARDVEMSIRRHGGDDGEPTRALRLDTGVGVMPQVRSEYYVKILATWERGSLEAAIAVTVGSPELCAITEAVRHVASASGVGEICMAYLRLDADDRQVIPRVVATEAPESSREHFHVFTRDRTDQALSEGSVSPLMDALVAIGIAIYASDERRTLDSLEAVRAIAATLGADPSELAQQSLQRLPDLFQIEDAWIRVFAAEG